MSPVRYPPFCLGPNGLSPCCTHWPLTLSNLVVKWSVLKLGYLKTIQYIALQWHHVNVMAAQITGKSSVCQHFVHAKRKKYAVYGESTDDRWIVRGPSYLGLTRSISWLLMPWLLTSPGHQQPWYWLYRICRSFSYSGKCFKNLCQINVEEWHKMQIYMFVPSEKFST